MTCSEQNPPLDDTVTPHFCSQCLDRLWFQKQTRHNTWYNDAVKKIIDINVLKSAVPVYYGTFLMQIRPNSHVTPATHRRLYQNVCVTICKPNKLQ